MSKDKPEVGDVFINIHNQKCFVLGKSEIPNTFDMLVLEDKSVSKYIDCVFWDNDYQYLGKSKANIDDLFKTENEE